MGFEIPVEVDIQGLSIGGAVKIELQSIDSHKLLIDTSTNNQDNVDFEIVDGGYWKTKDNIIFYDGKNPKNLIKIKVWDDGRFIFSAAVNNSSDIKSKSDTITIISGLNPQDSLKNLAPIKDIIKEKKTLKDYLDWKIILLLALIVIIALIYFIIKYRKNKERYVFTKQVPVVIRTPIEIALEKLEKLKVEKPWIKGKEKHYHEELTYILREFLGSKFNINANEQSTSELLRTLDDKDINNNIKTDISEILNISDMVKFAKASLELNINEKYLNRTIELVKELNDF